MTLSLRQAALRLGILVLIAYATGMTGGYHFDDSHSVESNLAVRSLSSIPSFWLNPQTSSFIPENRVYRPLVYTFYAFCWKLGGGATWPFHVMKKFMHLLVAVALFAIWRRLWREPGWFPVEHLKIKFPLVSKTLPINPETAALLLAAVFAIHPAGAECVDYISATTSLQCAMFYVWAFWFFLTFRETHQPKHLLLALFLYFCSVASKEEGITLPAMVLVTEFALGKGGFKTRAWEGIKRTLPFAGVALLLVAWIVIMHPTEGNESRGWVSPLHYFITQWRAWLWYMRIWFWPFDLNADSASIVFSTSLTDGLVIQAAIGNALLLLFAWAQRKRFPAMLYGLIWYYVTISPASSVVVLAEAINEHRMYLAYIGFVGGTFIVLLWCAEKFFAPETRATRLGWAYGAILIALLAGTWTRNVVWSDDFHLWQDTVEKNPTSGRALNNLALVYMSKGLYPEAVTRLEQCEQHWGTYMYCALNKGIALSALGRNSESQGRAEEAKKYYDQAESSFLRGYHLNPRSTHINFHYGQFLQDVRKNYQKASELFYTAVELTGWRYPSADLRLAECFRKLKRYDDARKALDRAYSLEPGGLSAEFEIGALELERGRFDSAIESYQRVVAANSRHLQGWYNLGIAYLGKSDLRQARAAFEKTVELDPKSEQGWFNLAFVAERLNDGKAAMNAARTLSSLYPARPDFKSRLSELEKKFGK